MKKIFLSTMIAMALATGASAGPAKMSIAVLELDANGVAGSEARALTDRLRAGLFTVGKFDVMEREKMAALLSERKLTAAGVDSMKSIIEIGRTISVNGMVSGSIGRLGNKYLLNVRLVDVETGMILATATEECRCPLEDLPAAMDKVAQLLAGRENQVEFIVQYYDRSNTAKGNFYIKSEPAGATVYLNDKMIRNVVTPLTIEDLPSGNYTVKAEKEKYAKSIDVTLRINEFKRIDLVMEKKQGKLSVSAGVPQADVYLSGQFMGKTPLTVNAVDLGTYTLQVKKEGYLEFTKQVEISDIEEARLEVNFVKPGPLKVMSTPMEAEVWLDNEYKGATPMVLTGLSLETHCLELRREGYAAFRDTITLVSDQETKVEPTLVLLKVTRPAVAKNEPPEGVGNKFDKSLKWITIGGATVFAVIVGLVLAR